MRFDQALARANALKLTDTRFAWMGYGLAVRGEGFWAWFQVEDAPALAQSHFAGELKTIASAVRTSKPDNFEMTHINGVPMQLIMRKGVTGVGQPQTIVPLADPSTFWPGFQPMNVQSLKADDMKRILAVAQRADQKDTIRPGLQCVRFFGDYVEAGDEAQFARAPTNLGHPGAFLVRASALDKVKVLQKTEPSIGYDGFNFYVMSHEETRIIQHVETWYPPLDPLFQSSAAQPGATFVVAAKALADALKVFKRKDQRRWLHLGIEGHFLNITSRSTGESGVCELEEVQHEASAALDLVVHGERLSLAAKTWTSSSMQVKWYPGWSRGPLSLVGKDGFVEHIYPLEASE